MAENNRRIRGTPRSRTRIVLDLESSPPQLSVNGNRNFRMAQNTRNSVTFVPHNSGASARNSVPLRRPYVPELTPDFDPAYIHNPDGVDNGHAQAPPAPSRRINRHGDTRRRPYVPELTSDFDPSYIHNPDEVDNEHADAPSAPSRRINRHGDNAAVPRRPRIPMPTPRLDSLPRRRSRGSGGIHGGVNRAPSAMLPSSSAAQDRERADLGFDPAEVAEATRRSQIAQGKQRADSASNPCYSEIDSDKELRKLARDMSMEPNEAGSGTVFDRAEVAEATRRSQIAQGKQRADSASNPCNSEIDSDEELIKLALDMSMEPNSTSEAGIGTESDEELLDGGEEEEEEELVPPPPTANIDNVAEAQREAGAAFAMLLSVKIQLKDELTALASRRCVSTVLAAMEARSYQPQASAGALAASADDCLSWASTQTWENDDCQSRASTQTWEL